LVVQAAAGSVGDQRLQVLAHRAGLARRVTPVGRSGLHPAVAAGVGLDHAGVHGEALAAHQPRRHAAAHHQLEHVAKQVALTEAAMPVLGEGGVVRDLAVQPEPAEPAIGQVEPDLLAKPPLRPDPVAVAHDQHADHQLGIDRGPPRRTVEGRQPGVQVA